MNVFYQSKLALVALGLMPFAVAGDSEPARNWAESRWPIGFAPPPEVKPDKDGKLKAGVLVWIPPGVEHPRALLLALNNSDTKAFFECGPVREVATKHQMAIVYFRNLPGYQIDPSKPPDGRQQVLEQIAAGTGKSEFLHAPWIAFGKSSCGQFPIQSAFNWPERTIATISYHAETPSWPVPANAKLAGETILHVNLNGETEWGGTWFHHVRPALLNFRGRKGWLCHQAIARGVGHGDYIDAAGSPGWGKPYPGKITCQAVWRYLAKFMDKALTLRLPGEGVPTTAPIALRQVDEASGLYLDPFAIEDVLRIPRFPLLDSPTGYILGDAAEPTVTGYAHILPAASPPPEGIPVVPVPLGKSPDAWVLASAAAGIMKQDPMSDLGDLQKLMPKPGDSVTVGETKLTFAAIEPTRVGKSGGIIPKGKVTLIASTVIDVREPGCFKIRAPFSPAGRLQLVVNGQLVEHRQVIELDKGLYPLLLVLRLEAQWGSVEPWFDPVTPDEIALGKQLSAGSDALKADRIRLKTTPHKSLDELFRRPDQISAEERKRMFWVPDRELAEAWLALEELGSTDRWSR